MNGYVIGVTMALTVLYVAMLGSSLATVHECWRARDWVAAGFWSLISAGLLLAFYLVLDAAVHIG